MDDRGGRNGADVLLPVHRYGHFVYLWLLYEKEVDVEQSTKQVEIFDTAIAMLAGLVVVPVVSLLSPKMDKGTVEKIFECYDEKVVRTKKQSLE